MCCFLTDVIPRFAPRSSLSRPSLIMQHALAETGLWCAEPQIELKVPSRSSELSSSFGDGFLYDCTAWDKGESFKTTVVATSPTPPRIRKGGEKPPLWKTIWAREALSPINNTLRITARLWLAHLWTQVKMQSSAAQAAQIFLPGTQQQPSGQGFTTRRRQWWEAAILVKVFLKFWDPFKDSDSQAGQAFSLSDFFFNSCFITKALQ